MQNEKVIKHRTRMYRQLGKTSENRRIKWIAIWYKKVTNTQSKKFPLKKNKTNHKHFTIQTSTTQLILSHRIGRWIFIARWGHSPLVWFKSKISLCDSWLWTIKINKVIHSNSPNVKKVIHFHVLINVNKHDMTWRDDDQAKMFT